MVLLQVTALISALSLTLAACGHDRPANDASGESTGSSNGAAPTGNSRPTDATIGTDMTPEPSNDSTSSSAGGPGANSGGSSGQ
jgi:hypothetical protein